jgi:serine protease Do
LVKASTFDPLLGARFEELTKQEKSALGISSGIKVAELGAGKLRAEGVKEGFIVTQVNNQPVNTVDDLQQVVKGVKGGIYLEGVYPNGVVAYYAFGLK